MRDPKDFIHDAIKSSLLLFPEELRIEILATLLREQPDVAGVTLILFSEVENETRRRDETNIEL